MPYTATLAEMRNEIRAETDTVNSTFVTDAQLNRWINKGIARLHDMEVASDPSRHLANTTINGVAGTLEYALPADFHSLITLDYLNGSDRYPVEPWPILEAAYGVLIPDVNGYPRARYRVMRSGEDGTGQRLVFDRDPGTNDFDLRYVATAPELDADTDEYEGVGGWEEWVVQYVCRKVAIKEERDPSFHLAEMARLEPEIRLMSGRRDQYRSGKVQNVRNRRLRYR